MLDEKDDDRRWQVTDKNIYDLGIEPWNAKTVEAELRKRGLNPVADNDGKGFESFHVTDLDSFALQISNGAEAKRRAAEWAESCQVRCRGVTGDTQYVIVLPAC